MAGQLRADIDDLRQRARRMHRLVAEIRPTSDNTRDLVHELVAIGPRPFVAAGHQFASSWALSLLLHADTLETTGEQLEAAADNYDLYEQALAEALGG